MIQTVCIVDSFVKIIIIKNHVDRTQFSNYLLLFYNLINECVTHDYTILSLYRMILITTNKYIHDEIYNMNDLDHQNKTQNA